MKSLKPSRLRVEIDPDFFLCMALLYYLDRDGLLFWLILFCILHELGHLCTVRYLGEQATQLRLSCIGMELKLSTAHAIRPRNRFLIALAGPTVNLLLFFLGTALAGAGKGPRLYLLAGMNLSLCLFNLLPVSWLDGGQIVLSVFEAFRHKQLGEKILKLCSLLFSCIIFFGGVLLFFWDRNFVFLLVGIWMILISCKRK